MRLVGLDLGTTKVAAVLFDAVTGRVTKALSRPHDARIEGAEPWEALEDPARIAEVSDELLAELASTAGGYDALCVTGQMHGGLYLDEELAPLSPLFSWLDNRGAEPHPSGRSYAAELSRRSGHRAAPGFLAATHFFNLERGLVPARAEALCSIMDWYAARLCGRRDAVTDATIAASFGLFDLGTMSIDEEAWSQMGSGSVRPPRLLPSGSLIGRDSSGRPIYLSLGDNQASLLGAIRDLDQAPLVNVGTGGQVSFFRRSGVEPLSELDARPFPGGGIILVGATLYAGGAYAMLEAFFREVCAELGGQPAGGSLFDQMNRLASRIDAAEALPVDTRFLGTRSDPEVRGSISGISPVRFRPANLIVGFIDGIAAELSGLLDELRPHAASPWRYMAASGNGVRRNPLLRARIEQRCRLPLRFPVEQEEAALGAALCAGVGAGVYRDFTSAARAVRYEGEN